MKHVTVETFLQAVRAREPGIRRSVDLWARKTTMTVKPDKIGRAIAPDGRPYSEPFTAFKMSKARGTN